MQTYLILLFYIGNIIWRCYFYCNRILDDVTMLLARFKYWAISISISTIELQKFGKIWVYIYMTDNTSFSIFYMCFVAQVFLSKPDKITLEPQKNMDFEHNLEHFVARIYGLGIIWLRPKWNTISYDLIMIIILTLSIVRKWTQFPRV